MDLLFQRGGARLRPSLRLFAFISSLKLILAQIDHR